MAAWLIEIKSQQVLPRGDEVEEELEDPRQELVRRLLEYKQYRDAASMLEDRGRAWQEHYPRLTERSARPRAKPGRRADPGSRAMGPCQRVWPDHPRERGGEAVEHRVRRHADPRLHGRIHARLVSGGNWPSATCSTLRCTSRRRWPFFWPCWNWCGITGRESNRTTCSARFGSCQI